MPISAEFAKRLDVFVAQANLGGGTGTLHQYDWNRFYQVVTEAYRERVDRPDREALRRELRPRLQQRGAVRATEIEDELSEFYDRALNMLDYLNLDTLRGS